MTDFAPARRAGRVAFATVRGSVARTRGAGRAVLTQPALAAAFLDGLRAGTQVEMAGHRWRVDTAKHEDRWVSGRLSSEHLAEAEPQIVWSPFVADLPEGRLAFQLRRTHTHPRTLAATFRTLLHRADPAHRWEVTVELSRVAWTDWRRSVDRLEELRLLLHRPNPNYGDRHQVQALIEGANAELLRMVLQADADSVAGIDVDAELVAQAIEHVQAGYGDFVAIGDRRDHGGAHVTSWQHRHGGTPLEIHVPIGADSPEVDHAVLRRELEVTRSAADRVPVPDRGDSDAELEAWTAEE